MKHPILYEFSIRLYHLIYVIMRVEFSHFLSTTARSTLPTGSTQAGLAEHQGATCVRLLSQGVLELSISLLLDGLRVLQLLD